MINNLFYNKTCSSNLLQDGLILEEYTRISEADFENMKEKFHFVSHTVHEFNFHHTSL